MAVVYFSLNGATSLRRMCELWSRVEYLGCAVENLFCYWLLFWASGDNKVINRHQTSNTGYNSQFASHPSMPCLTDQANVGVLQNRAATLFRMSPSIIYKLMVKLHIMQEDRLWSGHDKKMTRQEDHFLTLSAKRARRSAMAALHCQDQLRWC